MARSPWKTQLDLVYQHELGGGSFGKVYEAIDSRNPKRYAIKKISVSGSLNHDRTKKQIMREIDLNSKVKSKHVVQFVRFWIENSCKPYLAREIDDNLHDYSSTFDHQFLFIQMELCDGDLKSWLSSNLKNTFSTSLVSKLKMLKQITTGLKAIHQEKIIHRDLKPDNILYKKEEDGSLTWKICDFGLAISQEDEFLSHQGTLAYQSPEMRSEHTFGYKTDVYSFGLIILEILKSPLTRESRRNLFRDVRNNVNNTQLLNTLLEDLNCLGIVTLLAGMLKHDVIERFSSDDVLQHLELLLENETIIIDVKTNETSSDLPSQTYDATFTVTTGFIHIITRIITESPASTGKLNLLANALEVPEHEIVGMVPMVLMHVTTVYDAFYKILVNWISRQGSRATFGLLFKTLRSPEVAWEYPIDKILEYQWPIQNR